MIKILLFYGTPVNDAASIYRSGLAVKFLQKKYNIKIFSTSLNFKNVQTEKVEDLTVTFIGQAHYRASLSFSKRHNLSIREYFIESCRTSFRFKKILAKEKPDRVLVVSSLPVSLMVGITTKLLGYKVLLDIEDLASGQMAASGRSNLFANLYFFLEKIIVSLFDRTAVCSLYLKKIFPKSILIPNMVELGFWKVKRTVRPIRNIVMIGQIGYYHGQLETISAFTDLLRKNSNLKLILVGGGENEDVVKVKILKLKLTNQIKITGHVSQEKVSEFLGSSDIAILPIWKTPVHLARHPIKLLEYWASGICVVSGKPKEICNNVFGLINKPKEVFKVGRAEQKSVGRYSIEKVLPIWNNFLSK